MNEVQKHELQVLKAVSELCERHGLLYFAIGGTCIGAIRHHGFIPWDDDIDIAMPRPDYEHFRSLCIHELPANLQLLDYDTEAQFPYFFSKVHDTNTTLIGSSFIGNQRLYTGAFVDIMPIDGLPTGSSSEKMLKRASLFGWCHYKSRDLAIPGTGPKRVVKQMGRKILSVMCRRIDFAELTRKALEYSSFYDSDNCVFTWRVYDKSLPRRRLVFPSSWFRETIIVPFETTMIPVPAMVHEYLTNDFGDYMTLPPIDQRSSMHDMMIVDMDKSYRTYFDQDIRIR